MTNNTYKTNFFGLKFDFWLQLVLISLSAILTVLGLVGLIIKNSNLIGSSLIYLLILQSWTGVIQFLWSASPRIFNNYTELNVHRKIHFFVSILVIIVVILTISFLIASDLIDKNYLVWGIMWLYLLVMPQILMYYYFWITWKDWHNLKNS